MTRVEETRGVDAGGEVRFDHSSIPLRVHVPHLSYWGQCLFCENPLYWKTDDYWEEFKGMSDHECFIH